MSDYDQLQIDPKTKTLLRDLVEAHNSKKTLDNVPGRGVPLVFLLHGNPGMGKTYTTRKVPSHSGLKAKSGVPFALTIAQQKL